MPIALDPTQTFGLVLDNDSEKPEPQPTFTCRHLSCRDVIKLEQLTAKALDADGKLSNAETNAALNDCLNLFLVGWKNLGRDFAPDAVDDVLAPLEKFELIGKAPASMQIDFLLKKKSLLQRRSETERSAASASASGGATSPPANTTASTSPASTAAETVPSAST